MLSGLTIHLLILAFALALWICFFENKSLKQIFGFLAFAALFNYAIFLFTREASFNMKFADLSLSLFILAAVSLISQLVRKSFMIKILWLGVLGALLYHSFQKNDSNLINYNDEELDPSAELLLDLENKNEISNALQRIIDKYQLDVEVAFNPANEEETNLDDYLLINVPSDRMEDFRKIFRELRNCKGVDWVEQNEEIKLDPSLESQNIALRENVRTGVNDPELKKQWSYQRIGSDKLYNLLETENFNIQKRARLFILDTGVDANHEDLRASYHSVDSKSDQDKRGHGTHCAGIAGAVSNNNIGIASVAPNPSFYTITGIKVLGDSGIGFQKNIISGIIKAVDSGADVISMSLGARSNQIRQKAYDDAMAYANDHNTIVIVAAGNSNENAKYFCPANSKNVITVSAVDENLNKAIFSNTVQDIEYGISAPGVGIHSTFPQNQYVSFNGTSMAAPHVSGLVALMKSINPSMTLKEVYEVLDQTGLPTTSKSLTGNFIQADKAIQSLLDN